MIGGGVFGMVDINKFWEPCSMLLIF